MSTFYERVKEMFSRRCIGKLLLKLPSSFFPTYRVIFNVQVINNPGKDKDVATDSEYKCCKCCDGLYRYDEELEKSKSEKSLDSDREASLQSTPIPKPPPFPDYDYDEFAIKPCSTPIFLSDISQVKLRRSVDRRDSPRVLEVNDMLQILKRRYAAIHSPTFFVNDSSDENLFDSPEKKEVEVTVSDGGVIPENDSS